MGTHEVKKSTTKCCSYFRYLHVLQVLQEYGPSPSVVTKDWPVIGQFSSIGSLGPTPSSWLTSEWLTSLSACKRKEAATANVSLGPGIKGKLQLVYQIIHYLFDAICILFGLYRPFLFIPTIPILMYSFFILYYSLLSPSLSPSPPSFCY